MALEAITAVFYLFILLVITEVIGLIVFWVLMIIDCAKRNFERPNEQIAGFLF